MLFPIVWEGLSIPRNGWVDLKAVKYRESKPRWRDLSVCLYVNQPFFPLAYQKAACNKLCV